jgi:hypothetical protein
MTVLRKICGALRRRPLSTSSKSRSTSFYRRGVMPWGSSAIACLALVWFVQRAML